MGFISPALLLAERSGTLGLTSGRNAQCSFQCAPSSIQLRSAETSSAVSRAPSGGI